MSVPDLVRRVTPDRYELEHAWLFHLALGLATFAVLSAFVLLFFAAGFETTDLSGEQPTLAERQRGAILWTWAFGATASLLIPGLAWSVLCRWRGVKVWRAIWSLPFLFVFFGGLAAMGLPLAWIPLLEALWLAGWAVAAAKSRRPRKVVVAWAIATWVAVATGLVLRLQAPPGASASALPDDQIIVALR